MNHVAPIPATILTGFLGAGKTTLLNAIVRNDRGRRFGIILNEVAEISIDDELIESRDEEVMLLKNGCICCSVRVDLVQSIRALLARGGIEYLLVETTGVANPRPIVDTFYSIPSLSPLVRLDSIVTVLDVEHIEQQAKQERVAIDQIAMADFVLLNKVDLASEAQIGRVERSVRKINPHARLFRSKNSEIDLQGVLDVNAFKVDEDAAGSPEFVPVEAGRDDGHASIDALSFALDGLLDGFKFQSFAQALSQRECVYRSKGIVAIGGSRHRAVFHGVNNRFTIYWDRLWRSDEARTSRLVFIGKALRREPIEWGLRQCLLYRDQTAMYLES
jgi:G3E family GTPase